MIVLWQSLYCMRYMRASSLATLDPAVRCWRHAVRPCPWMVSELWLLSAADLSMGGRRPGPRSPTEVHRPPAPQHLRGVAALCAGGGAAVFGCLNGLSGVVYTRRHSA